MRLTNLLTLLCLLVAPALAQVGPLVHTNKNDIAIIWDANAEVDLAGYEVWRSTNATFATVDGVGPVKVTLGKVITYTWVDLPDGTYWLGVVAADATGNLSKLSNVLNYRVDTVLPVLSGLTLTGITATGATVRWTTNEPSDTQVESGITTTYGRISALKPALVTAHEEVLTGLLPGTLYHYKLKSADAAGNAVVSLDLTFTTLPLDITPPPPPTNLRVPVVTALTPTTSTIAWKTEEEASGFLVLFTDRAAPQVFEGNRVIRTTDHVVLLTGLIPNTKYKYQAFSRSATSAEIFRGGGSFVTK